MQHTTDNQQTADNQATEIHSTKFRDILNDTQAAVVAVTGGIGKSSTALAIGKMLETTCNVALIGDERQVDSDRQDLDTAEVLVLDLDPQQIEGLEEVLRPDILVLTGSADPADALRSLANSSGVLIVNQDDEHLVEILSGIEGDRVKTYGLKQGDVHFGNRWETLRGGHIKTNMYVKDTKEIVYTRQVVAFAMRHLAAAVLVGTHFGLPLKVIVKRLSKINQAPGCMKPLAGKRRSLIIDNSYRTAPETALAALRALKIVSQRRTIAVIGSLASPLNVREAYRQVGAACGDISLLVTIGDAAAEWLVPTAAAAGLSTDDIVSFSDPAAAGKHLARALEHGDVVLTLGSGEGVYVEEAVKPLLANPRQDTWLVRQSPEWLETKRQQ